MRQERDQGKWWRGRRMKVFAPWGRGLDSYLQWFYETIVLSHELLHETGSLYVHLDWHVSHYAKALLDEVLGRR